MPVQLMRPGIGHNMSCTVNDFAYLLGLPFFQRDVVHWLFIHSLIIAMQHSSLYLYMYMYTHASYLHDSLLVKVVHWWP